MSVRKKSAQSRVTLFRECGTCGAFFLTSADSPWIRQVPRDGKRQATTYYCSESCCQSSYKHLFDGKAEERRSERERRRDRSEYRKRRYAENREKEKAYSKARYWANPEAAREANRYAKRKRKLLDEEKRVP